MTKSSPSIKNRKALRDFHIEKTYEAGMQLQGNEVKSLRNGKATLTGCFARVENGEVFLYNMHISPYEYSRDDYNPIRRRKLLLHKAQIRQIEILTQRKGDTLVVLKVYFKRGFAKVELAVAKGKNLYDKRSSLKEKQANREIIRTLSRKNK